jgi:hypothetical protein
MVSPQNLRELQRTRQSPLPEVLRTFSLLRKRAGADAQQYSKNMPLPECEKGGNKSLNTPVLTWIDSSVPENRDVGTRELLFDCPVGVAKSLDFGMLSVTLSWILGDRMMSGSPTRGGQFWQSADEPCHESGWSCFHLPTLSWVDGDRMTMVPQARGDQSQSARQGAERQRPAADVPQHCKHTTAQKLEAGCSAIEVSGRKSDVDNKEK